MEFKVFKNENSKILKEYWLTPSEWDALDKTTVQEGDIYHIVGTIDKGDLSADVNASLAKGDSSLQKPTATLAKESFAKVGIDGTQKFDESSYVVAPSTDGTAGQVLKKTATGTEWANESGGGKYYMHNVTIYNKNTPSLLPNVNFKYISTDNTKFSLNKLNFKICFDVITADTTTPPKYYKVDDMRVNTNDKTKFDILYYPSYPYSVIAQATSTIPIADIEIIDDVIEL